MTAVSQQVVLSGVDGTPKRKTASEVTTPGSEQTLISFTTTLNKTTKPRYLKVTCRQWGTWKLKIGSELIGSGRNGPGHLDSDYPWVAPEGVQGGVQILLTYLAGSKSAPSDVEAHLQYTEQ